MKKETRQEIRKNYQNWRPHSDPYQYGDWIHLFTPIESNVWHDIRANGLPFYPQFPVGPYFLDFADPVKKVGIEVDGKEYHSTVAQLLHDKKREKELNKLGWTIFRLKGRQTFKDRDSFVRQCQENGCEVNNGDICSEHLDRYRTDCSEGLLLDLMESFLYAF